MTTHSKLGLPVGETGAFVQALTSGAVVVLVTLGAGGIAYQLFAPGGWLAQVFTRSFAAGLAALFSIVIVMFSVWQLRPWISVRYRRRYAEFATYGLVAAGIYFAAQIATRGSL